MSLIDEVQAARSLPPPREAAAIRRAGRITQERLAEELGVHAMTVARWEAGRRIPRGAVRVAYARLLGEISRAVAS